MLSFHRSRRWEPEIRKISALVPIASIASGRFDLCRDCLRLVTCEKFCRAQNPCDLSGSWDLETIFHTLVERLGRRWRWGFSKEENEMNWATVRPLDCATG